MASAKQHTLGRDERLKSRKLIDRVFKEGRAFSVFPFRVIYIFTDNKEHRLQAGFSASSRNFKKAVDRNRIKRITKEAYRIKKSELVEALTVNDQSVSLFLVYTAK